MTNVLPAAKRPVFILFILFFLSGFAALLYQVIWQRLLVFYTGSDTVSISLIVSAFMTGLGLGYLVGGRLADRATPAINLRYFVGAEVGILLFAAFSKAILYDYLFQSAPDFGDNTLVLYAVVFGVLLVPTFLMGFSLPALSKAFRFADGTEQARYISLLYFVNTLGAAVGAFVTGFVLVRQMGYASSIWVGVAFNGICAIGALGLGRQQPQTGAATASDPETGSLTFTPMLTLWSTHYFLSGLAALSLELIWFRVLETLIKSVSLTFSVLLAIYLGSMAIGTWVGVRLVKGRAFQVPARRERLFLIAQIMLYSYTGLSVVIFIGSVSNVPALRFLWDYFLSGEPVLNARFMLFTYGLIPVFLLFIPTFMMGLSFAVSQSLIQDRYEEVGRKVGWLQFINIVGSAVGAWWVTWVWFPLFGSAELLRLIAGLSLVYGFVLFYRKYIHPLAMIVLVIVQLLAILTIPDNNRFWQLMNGVRSEKQILFNENESGVSVIKLDSNQRSGVVFVNGLGQSGLPFYIDEVHTLLGGLPVMIHPNPKKVAVIGLGSGGTVQGIGGRAETRRIDCFEIVSNQAQLLAEYAAVANDRAVDYVLSDKRLQLIFRDGRYALRQRPDLYDVIEADALRPSSAFSGNIYSKEYFELLRSRLKPKGLAVTWCPTGRVLNTFRQVFPYVLYVEHLVLIGSNEPIPLDWAAIEQRATSTFSKQHYGTANVDLWKLIGKYRPVTQLLPRPTTLPAEINTDLFPKDEYSIRQRDKVAY